MTSGIMMYVFGLATSGTVTPSADSSSARSAGVTDSARSASPLRTAFTRVPASATIRRLIVRTGTAPSTQSSRAVSTAETPGW
ncbi:hypothetical protein BJF78_04160 [Pseudonocardia sp. CNS-139]|nr:hypothetical protein BJF78_04160 [Pseudonocardia sp. CNS-139]